MNAWVSSLEELDWDVKVLKDLPEGGTPDMAEAQRKFLKARYDKIKNLKEAIGQISLADIRGYTILQKHRDDQGVVKELYWLEPWVWSREGYYGDFFYNENSQFGIGLGTCATILGERNRIGGEELPRQEFVIREVESPLYEIALIAFVNWLMGRKDWAAFVEIFGLAKGVVIMPPNITVGKEEEFQIAAEKVSDGISGSLPNGADIKFPTAGVRGESPFKIYCDAQDADLVLAATSGLLSMLTHGGGGLNQGPHQEHGDVWEKIAKMKGNRVNEVFRQDIDMVELAAEFPGQPVCVQFVLAVQDDEDVNTVADTVVKLEGVGLQTDAKEIATRTGYKLTRVPMPGTGAGGASGAAKADQRPDMRELSQAVMNRLLNQGVPDASDADLEAFATGVADDLAHALARLQAISDIKDDVIFEKKLKEFHAEFPALKADILKDPAADRKLLPIITHSFLQGLTGAGPVKNRTILNMGGDQPRDSLGKWVDENGGGLSPKENQQRGEKAMDRALRQKTDVQKAMYRKGPGQIDFKWGTPGNKSADYAGGSGVAHVLAKHGEADARNLPEVLAKGKITAHPESEDKLLVTHQNSVAALARENKNKAWVITSFERRAGR